MVVCARISLVVFLSLALGGCGEDHAGKAVDEVAPAQAAVEKEAQLVVTLHVRGGEVSDLEYLRKQAGDFGNSQEARKNTDTWAVYVLMKPGVPEEFAVEQRNMLEAYVRPPLEFLMSSWSRNENDWFRLLPE